MLQKNQATSLFPSLAAPNAAQKEYEPPVDTQLVAKTAASRSALAL
jgi:hypothetical protein